MYQEQNKKHFEDIAKVVRRRLLVMIVDDQPARAALLEHALVENGYEVRRLLSANGLVQEVARHEPDIIIVDVDSPDRDTLEHMANLNDSNPHPMVMLAEQDSSHTVHRAINAGVSTYIVNGLQPQLVKSIVEVAIARFREFQALREELEHTKDQLIERKIIEKAKIHLIRHRNMTEEQAYKAMRKIAMDNCQRLVTVAKNITDIFDLLDQPIGAEDNLG